MKLSFYGGAKNVTGANYLLESGSLGGETRILIDCGLNQGSNFCERLNFEPFPYDPRSVDALLVTHAHIDHTGRIPKLYKNGFRGKIYSTPPTKEFAHFMLLDSEGILTKEALRENREPIFNSEDVGESMKLWEGIEYHKELQVGNFKIKFWNAGHILGSAFILVEAEGKKIIFSGDLGNNPPPIIQPTEMPEEADYCLIESTYGNRTHEEEAIFKNYLEDIIEDTVKSKGTLLIPAFAMERTQKLLYELNELIENGRIPKIPIFVDSPLAIKLTSVYKKYQKYFNPEADILIRGGDAIFDFPGLKTTLRTEDSKAINNVPAPKVIIAGSGMSQGGRILHHEKRYLSDPKSTIIFVGYQAEGSLGRQILNGEKVVRILGGDIYVNCRILTLPGYSAHADQPQLLKWINPMRKSLKKIFIVQGEETSAEALGQKIRDELAIPTHIPEIKESVIL